ncbi:TonB-dependent receptor [Thalassotalea mangrovi]|uniref:TonB-dependent receptor n=1 Tax=Thalassotalea mangrovi TaxID=2572245 RepID=A0A4U1B755_9GAMM|nr:TonB-dependent receptor [Thalassotalea mangrovi]TKB46039.1 TonB-dependent receptor [Thalassotalea mangrovi]
MHKRDKLSLAITTALIAQLSTVSIATAAEASGEFAEESSIERIEVRTRRITETIETIPLAISAIPEAQIAEKGIQSADDVAKYVNGLAFDIGAAANDTRPSLRGLTIDRGRPNVAVLVDGVDVSSESVTLAGGGITANMKLLDLQQVEVVKGPQSVNYGRSAFSGAINYVTKRPSFDNEGNFMLNVAEHGIYDISASYEGAITDSFAAKIKLIDSASDGYYENPNTGGALGESDVSGGALSFFFIPSDSFSAYFRAEYSDEQHGPRPVVAINSMLPEFDPQTNFFATGSVNTAQGGGMFPYEFDENGVGVDCSMAYQYPYWDSFNNVLAMMGFPPQPACRAMVTGDIRVGEDMIDLSPDPLTGKDYPGTSIENTRASLELEWDFDSMSFVSITAYTKSDAYIQEDFDKTDFRIYSDPVGVPFANIPPWSQFGMQSDVDTSYDVEQFNQEFRLTGEGESYNWVVSGLYWYEEMDTGFGSQFWLREGASEEVLLAQFAQSPFTSFITDIKNEPLPKGENRITPITRDTEHWSVAALINFALTDDMNLTFEGRYMDETIEYTGNADDRTFDAFNIDNSVIFDPNNPPTFTSPNPNYFTSNSVSSDEFLPRITFDYQVNDTVFTYASAAKGFKPGGITTTDANGDVSTGEYKPETLWAYEIGAKAFNEKNNVLVNLAAFYWEYTDQQVPYTFFNDIGLATVSVINAGETVSQGVELDSIWQITPSFRMSFAYLYSDAEYTSFNVAEIIASTDIPSASVNDVDKMIAGNADADFTGKRLTMSPKHSATFSARYSTEFGKYGAFIEMFGQYKSERNVDRGGYAQLPAYDEWDLTAGLEADSWKLTLYVENLFDDDTIKSSVGNVGYGFFPDGRALPFSVHATLPQPRTAGARVMFTF